jgi:hypothetical protein
MLISVNELLHFFEDGRVRGLAHLPSKVENASKAGFIPVHPLPGGQNLVAKCYKLVRTASLGH